MSLLGIFGVAYGTVALILFRPFAGDVAWRSQNATPTGGKLDGGDLIFGFFFGAMGALVWPIVIVTMIVGRYLVIGAEREARLREREQHVRDLERELEVTR